MLGTITLDIFFCFIKANNNDPLSLFEKGMILGHKSTYTFSLLDKLSAAELSDV